MKILHIVNGKVPRNPSESSVSGIVLATINIAQRQAELGHTVSVVSVSSEVFNRQWKGINLYSLKEWPYARIILGKKNLNFRIHGPLISLTRRYQFDVIHGHQYTYFRFLRAKRFYAHFHSDPFHPGAKPYESLDYKPSDWLTVSRYSTGYFVPSNFLAGQLILGGLERDKITVVPNGIEINKFLQPVASSTIRGFRNKWNLTSKDYIFLFVGAITPEKGLLELLQSFRYLQKRKLNIKLLIVGSSSLWGMNSNRISQYEDSLRHYSNNRTTRGSVVWAGKIRNDSMPVVYSSVDAVVAPSLWSEGFHLVTLEAMVSGKPVIGSSHGGIGELLNLSGGLTISPFRPRTMVSSMSILSRYPSMAKSLGRKLQKYAQRYTWERSVDIIEKTITG
ncbi:hypothetical protein BXT84_10785 [Sulfobacillus thermotolerans]|uniref:Glycosyl transferase family 1 domain-containing protein n=1 Tax=Sulfobacillus thermotolerans TaxID=338644 RepID=A0ABM6RSU4_9FIRM|nr:hypothetical protein BXT84_10785 [Sulfobacillus thermotolerans]